MLAFPDFNGIGPRGFAEVVFAFALSRGRPSFEAL